MVTSGGQAELGRALGGYINVVTKSGTNASARRPLRLLPRRSLQRGERALRHDAADEPEAVRREPRRPDRPRPDVLLLELRAAQAGPDRPRHHPGPRASPSSTRGWRRPAIRVRRSRPAIYPNPVHSANFLGEGRSSVQRHGSVQRSLQPVRRHVAATPAAPARLNAPSASAGLDNIDQTVAVSNTLTLSPRTVNETRAQFAYGDLKAPPTDPIGPAVSIAGVASFGTLSGSPTGRVNKMYQVVDNLSHQAGAHALRAGVDFLYNDDTITYPRSIRGTYTFSSLANFLSGAYNNAGFTQTFGATVVSQTNPNRRHLRAGRVEGQSRADAERGPALRPAVPGDDRHRHEQRVAARRASPGRRSESQTHGRARQRRALLRPRAAARAGERAPVGRQHDRPGQPAARSASAFPRRRPARPSFPNILSAAVPSVTLVNLTTMNRNMQNAYSRQASLEVEQQLGGAQHGQRRLPVPARREPDHLGEPERADVRGGGHQQRLPSESELREQQPVFSVARPPTITACTCRSCSGRRAGATTASPTRSRSR